MGIEMSQKYTDFRDQFNGVKDYYQNFKENRIPHSLTPQRRPTSQINSGKSHSAPLLPSNPPRGRGNQRRPYSEIPTGSQRSPPRPIRIRSPSRTGNFNTSIYLQN